MLRFKEFLNTQPQMGQPKPGAPGQQPGQQANPTPPPDLVSLANKAKQAVTQAQTASGPGAADKMKQLQQIGAELTAKNQQFQLQQFGSIANKILQTAQPLTGR